VPKPVLYHHHHIVHLGHINMSQYQNLPVDEEIDDEEDIDFSDLKAQFEVRLEEGLDAFVVLDGLPKVPEDSKDKLKKFISRKLNTVGKVRDEGFHMPVNSENMTQG
jgi:translation initiation factor 3 subunit B